MSKDELRTYSVPDDAEYKDYYNVLGYDTLIPNKDFARLFNSKGELEVGEYIVKVTPHGTYKFKKGKEARFNTLYASNSCLKGRLIENDYYQIEPDIYYYDTFKKYSSDVNYYEYAPDKENTVALRSYGSEPDFNSFATFEADRHTVVGIWIQRIIGAKKDHTLYYEHTDNRRMRGSFYSYNYGVYAETGVEGWTDKKNWIGWSKTASDELRVGWKDVVLITKPDVSFQNMLKGVSDVLPLPPQYMDIPGMNRINVKTLVIPGYKAKEWEREYSQGAKLAFNTLKNYCNNPKDKDEIDQAQTLIVVTEPQLYLYIKNADVRKYGEERYVHVFSDQLKLQIVFNPSSLITSILKSLKETYELKCPTLDTGEAYICARFGNEWQGMKIVKK
ncbi:MAG: hypothetical protein LBC19_13140 [Tannerella sp.]|jgi:hypothetical protein|nr:hypothetical protein [Tannerella sp.]